MAKSYYSTVFEQPADKVWAMIRDFNAYPVWVDGAGTSEIEQGKTGEAVGAVRSVQFKGRHIRQRLLALSDLERRQTYTFAGQHDLPVDNFEATIKVTPIVDGNRAFLEWWATFDCESARRAEQAKWFRESFAGWLESLRRALMKQAA